MGDLADKVKQRSPFLRLENGESIVATYKGYKMVPSTYDPEKENFRFLLEVEINGEKQMKYWDTGANKVAMVFDAAKVGDMVKITKNVLVGKNGKESTAWEVVPVADKEGTVTKEEAKKVGKQMSG